MNDPHDMDLGRLYDLATGKNMEEDSWEKWRYRPQNMKLIAKYRRPKVS